jgi:1-acyl-sn-glycerol-3-phosphate acyltransferase
VPVVPVAQWGAQDILPYGSTKPHLVPRKMVRMLAGPPVDLREFEGKPLTRDVLRGATDAIMADITKLLAELRGEQPPAAPYDPAAARRAARAQAAAAPDAQEPSSQTESSSGTDPREATPT